MRSTTIIIDCLETFVENTLHFLLVSKNKTFFFVCSEATTNSSFFGFAQQFAISRLQKVNFKNLLASKILQNVVHHHPFLMHTHQFAFHPRKLSSPIFLFKGWFDVTGFLYEFQEEFAFFLRLCKYYGENISSGLCYVVVYSRRL